MSSDEDTLKRTLDKYRRKIDFEETVKISHPADCYTGNCSLVGYKDGDRLRYQEQTGKYPEVDQETPDWNPRGCGRQCNHTDATYGDERVKQPMKQVGDRGSGKWEPISWEQAYREIAEAMVEAMEKNPQSIINEIPPAQGGDYNISPWMNMVSQAGGINLDIMTGGSADFAAGMYQTFGKYNFASSQAEWFKADVNVVWHMNPAYTRQSGYHFLTESRYDGGETIVIAPDYSPTCVHADKYVPVEPASDAALALGMCKHIVEEDLVDREFVKEQTDLPLLIREDTNHFLREEDIEADGREDWFYVWDAEDGLVQAPRETLKLEGIDPVLEGSYEVEIDGETVTVKPVFERLRKQVFDEYDPETVQEISGVHPEVIEELAETFANNRTFVMGGANTYKTFHGDLIERSMCLLVALTGNWGQEGTGIRNWNVIFEANMLNEEIMAPDPLMERIVKERAGRELTDEELNRRVQQLMHELSSVSVPAAFFWYRHAGYDEFWEQASMKSAEMPRDITESLEEATERGWWEGVDLPEEDVDPRVAFFPASNALRNKAGTSRTYLQKLWPKLDLVVTIDYRWSTTALYSDIVLPGAFYHEKEQFQAMTSPEVRFWSYADKAIDPVHDSKNELKIMEGICSALEDVAAERGLEEYEVPHGTTLEDFNQKLTGTSIDELEALSPELEKSIGVTRRYDEFYERTVGELSGLSEGEDYNKNEVDPFSEDKIERLVENSVEACVEKGIFKEGTKLEDIKERGFTKFEGLGEMVSGLNEAANVEPNETVTALDQHVQDKKVYPSLTGRAQFYVDHEWFLEANEQLPRHKSPPASLGGDREEYPFFVTSGHIRHGTHSTILTNETQMNLHRGEPHLFINRQAAEEKGIEDGQYVRVHNNYNEVYIQAKVSSQPSRDQVVFYHGWDPYLHPEGKGMKDLIPALVKPTHFAGGYGHFSYYLANWVQGPLYRHVCVDVEPVDTIE